MKLGELLSTKDFKHRAVVTVRQDETIAAAIRKLVEHDMGSLPVCNDKDEPVGVITERDMVRKCFARNIAPNKIKVQDIMSKDVIIGVPEDSLDYAINVMKQKRIRHLPIVDNKKVVGMISMRDLLGVQVKEYEARVRLLSDYISGYPG